ncbi:MAG: DUF799 domain-containing protein [Treponema sp.]|nr:DUF799 domain-containing protein [Treponema sp.]
MKKLILVASILSLFMMMFVSCDSTPKEEAYQQWYYEEPLSILIMPPVNLSHEDDMNDIFYSMLAKPLAEAGYYVFPPHFSNELFKKSDKSESYLALSVKEFGQKYGADMVLFTRINYCYKSVLLSEVTVDADFIVKSTKTDEILFEKNVNVSQDTKTELSNTEPGETRSFFEFFIDTAATAVTTSLTSYEKLVRDSGAQTFEYMPYGPYHPSYLLDKEEYAGSDRIKVSR